MKRFVFVPLMLIVLAACHRNESGNTIATDTDTARSAAAATAGTDTSTTTVPSADLQFATTASMANLYEIKAGELVHRKATGDSYKKFAHMMVEQHREIGASYEKIVKNQGLPMPTELEGDFKLLFEELERMPAGDDFDALYKQQMMTTHQAAVPLFEAEAASGQDPPLKNFALQWVGMIETHLTEAQALPLVP